MTDVQGAAHITITPTNPSLRVVYLHASPRLNIRSVTLASPTPIDPLIPTKTSFTHASPFQPLPAREPRMDLKSHPEMKRKSWAAMAETDEGELAIAVSGGWVRLIQGEQGVEFAPIQLQIEYSLSLGGDVTDGIVFRRGEDESPHMFLSPTCNTSSRIWTPCVDDLWDRCTWELEFTVTHSEDFDPIVIATGELMEQVIHPHSPNKSIFYYLHANPTSVQHVLFAAGPFRVIDVGQYENKMITAFCLPGEEDEVTNSTRFMEQAMSFLSKEYGSFPFQDYKMVFISEPRTTCATGATLSLFSADLLHPSTILDQAFESRQVFTLSFAQQWIGINIIPRALSDTWLANGLASYLQSAFLRHLFGNNEHRFRLKKDIDKCARLDQGNFSPLCVPGTHTIDLSFINLKAPLVLHILDRHLAKAGTSLGLSRVIPRILLSALSDELSGNMLSTAYFFKTCRKVSGLDLQAFQDQWVYGSGCPHFKIQTNFIRKKFLIEMGVQQFQPASESTKRPTTFFEGSLTIRIHEADGAPFEHLVDIKQSFKVFSLPFNTKYKRTRRSGRIAARFSRLEDEMAADEEEARLIDVDRSEIFAYPMWDNFEERLAWRVAEWSDEQAEMMYGEGGGYEWIRIDPECEWIAWFEFSEKPWYWISQLQGDKDVVAQVEAIQHLAMNLSPVVASELAKTVLVRNFYYRVRIEAIKVLVLCNSQACDYLGSFLLLKLFDELFGTPQQRIESFQDLAEHFVLKALVMSLADLRHPATRQPLSEALDLLLDLFSTHDNTTNMYDDSFFTATVIGALGNMITSSSDTRLSDAIDRAITMDRLLPSYRNIVTFSALEAHVKSIVCGQRTNDPSLFLAYSREGNLRSIRCLALDCLLVCRPVGRSFAIAQYLLEVVKNDKSLLVRRHVATSLSESILLSLAMGDMYMPSSSIGISEGDDTEQARKQKSETHNKSIVKALRKDFEDKAGFIGALEQTLMTDFGRLDADLRFALLKMAEITTSSTNEPVPGAVITLQTPVTETLLPPKIRLNIPETFKEDSPLKLVLNPKKVKVTPAQKAGLPEKDMKAIQVVLDKLVGQTKDLTDDQFASETSIPFRQPVDPLRDHAPNYLTIIRQPMDLSTAKAKLDNGLYASRFEFAQDMRLIVSNCSTYNASGSPVNLTGEAFNRYFERLWSKTENTLSSADALLQANMPMTASQSTHNSQTLTKDSPVTKVKVKPVRPLIEVPTLPATVPSPMPPPPLPTNRRQSTSVPEAPPKIKKRLHDTENLDDMLGAEVDAISQKPLKTTTSQSLAVKKSRQSPEKRESPAESVRVPSKVHLPKVPSPVVAVAPSTQTAVSTSDARLKEKPSQMLPVMPFKQKRAKHFISSLCKEPTASIFLRPVDPQLDGCPTYFMEIKHPMDLGTISKRVDSKKYKTMQDMAKDVELVVAKYVLIRPDSQFNPPGEITDMADGLEKVYLREWPKATSAKMYPDEKRSMSALLARAMKDDLSFYFREAVDPVALGIPQYFLIIPPEDARDLSLIKSKLDKGQYTTAKQVDDDVDLMLENARVFNGEGPVVDAANTLGRWWKSNRARMD